MVNRNKEPRDGSMWTKTIESAAISTQKPMISTGLTDLEKREVDRLREENVTLRQALEQVRKKCK